MRRKERRHLKQNPVADIVFAARRATDEYARQITTVAVVIVVALVALLAIVVVRQQTATRADVLLADAMKVLNTEVVPADALDEDNVPAVAQLNSARSFASQTAKLTAALPLLQAASDTYPNTQAAITARYHWAAALAELGRHDEAIAQFDDVERRAGEGALYGRMARLGRADTLVQAGRFDEAIAVWADLAERADGGLPPDAILMELARVYVAKGDTAEARRTLSTLVADHPDSVYWVEARARLGSLPG